MSTSVPLKRTPLFAVHQRAGARLVEFGGWEMPLFYSSIVDEHLCVRRAAGLFDISHMGQVRISGPGAAAFLNATLTNDIARLVVGLGQYTLMCSDNGGVIDDLYAYRLGEQEYLLVVNASRAQADLAWLQQRRALLAGGVEVEDLSATTGAVAVQGPRVAQFMDACFPGASAAGRRAACVTELRKNEVGQWRLLDRPVWIGRTGYTGEDGFEILTSAETIEAVWNHVLARGHVGCLQPCGLGARDTLRTEACFPLYGHELDENTTPLEAGLGAFVALEKGEFVGRAVLARQKAEGVARVCIAFRMTGKSAPPRPGYAIWAGGGKVGVVTSGTQSPSLGCGIGLGFVLPPLAVPGTGIEIEIRGQRHAAEVVKKPFYRRPPPRGETV